jgi:hypothetical protein
MKMLIKQAFVSLSKKELNQLTAEVKETVFIEPNIPTNSKTFTGAELRRIQNFKRPVTIRKGFNPWQ